MEIYYGIENNYKEVTYIAFTKCYKEGKLIIPDNDGKRSYIFGDPLYGIVKHILINDTKTGNEYIYDIFSKINIKIKDNIDIENIKNNYLEKIKNKSISPEIRLDMIQQLICIDFGNKYEEQLMSVMFLDENATVLELGGNLGRNSCVIATLLNDNRRLVTLECSEEISKKLIHNRDINNLNFNVEVSALSKVSLSFRKKDSRTIVSDEIIEGYNKVNTITFDELKEKYKLNFDTLVVDCEGGLYQILVDEPNLLENIKLVIIINEFLDIGHKRFVDSMFDKYGLKIVYEKCGGWGHFYDCFYQVFKK